MAIRYRYVVLVFYLFLSLDSLLKFDYGFKIQLAVAMAVAFVGLCLLVKPWVVVRGFLSDFYLYLFLFYCFLSGLWFSTDGVHLVSIYIVFIVCVSLFVSITYSSWNSSVFLYFQWALIASGLIQYLLYKLLGYQLSFIDAEHYSKGFSVSSRLRGFFVEPNWFSIALAFNTIILVRDGVHRFYQGKRAVLLLTFFVFILNGSFATFGVLLLVLSFSALRKGGLASVFILLGFVVLLGALFAFRNALSPDDTAAFNYASRLTPMLRVIDYQLEQGGWAFLWGNGFGSWGGDAIFYRLSTLVHELNPGVRDASELPVFLFELGVFGVSLVFVDCIRLIYKAGLERYFLSGGILLFIVCFTFYPIYKFMMYMPYYFYIRQEILRG